MSASSQNSLKVITLFFRLATTVLPSTTSTSLRLFLIFSAFSVWNLSRTACKAAWAFLTAPSRMPSSPSSCASAVRRLTGLAPFCGRVCEGSDSNTSHTSAEAAGLGFISTGLTRIRPLGGDVSSPLNKVLTTSLTVFVLNLGSRHSTEFKRSLPGIRLASGVRTIRPSNCVICVLSLAARKETITSARGQSQPVLMASLAISTRTQVDSCTRCGSI